ncbi:helix-turn-helix domain-containing protein [Halorubrum ejinorense]|uniref:Helix-turn-helix domain-containing protein n=1 Tax=Halorubrum ejinorense TaxID=425309 RepID=A0ABV4IL39_9EURY
MSKTQSEDERNAQRTDSNSGSPSEADHREQPDNLSSNFSEYSDEKLAEMSESALKTGSIEELEQARKRSLQRAKVARLARQYESIQSTGSVKQLKQARQRSLRGYTDEEFARRCRRARGESVNSERVSPVTATDEQPAPPALADYELKQVICEEFGKEGWSVMKPLLATHATLLLDDIESSRAMMVEGQSGVGKTMLLKTFGDLNEQFCRRSDVTPASFVSAGGSNSDNDSTNNDLLPLLEGRTLAVGDAQTLFAGSERTVESTWRKLARIMDGDGYYRQTATGGKVGYDDIRFNFIGATTPLSPRAWKMMGNVGQRLLLVQWPDEDYDGDWLCSVVEGGEHQPIERGRDAVQEFLQDLWNYHGGTESVTWTDDSIRKNVRVPIQRLARVVAHARGSVHDGAVQIEAPKRIGKLLHDLARGHALIHGRTHLELEDVEACGRVALSTMPAKRRGIVRALLDPNRDDPLTAGDVEMILDVSRPTARNRIDEMVALGIGDVVEETGRGGTTKAVVVNAEFRWPDGIAFPDF